MSAVASNRGRVESRRSGLPTWRLVNAEVLKLRKRRGLVALTAVTTVGVTLITYGVLIVLHAVNPGHYGPAGGVDHLGTGIGVLSGLAGVAATIVGATAGAGDLGAGVFRELVVTGRPRQALFNARIPGGFLFLLPFVAVAFALTAVASVAFAGSLPAPSAELLAESGAYVLLPVAFGYVLALGVASVLGSRSTTIGVLLAWWLAVSPLLLAIGFLGAAREALPSVAIDRFIPGELAGMLKPDNEPSMSVAAAAAVLVVWTVVVLAVGSWRTRTQDA
jgi:hypothetical protein